MRRHLARYTIRLMPHWTSNTSSRRHRMLALRWSSELIETVSTSMVHTAAILTTRMLILQVGKSWHVSSHMASLIHSATWRATAHWVHVVAISIHGPSLFALVSISLGCIIHLNWSAHYNFALHFLKSAFRLFFLTKFDETISFRLSSDWVTDDLSLKA